MQTSMSATLSIIAGVSLSALVFGAPSLNAQGGFNPFWQDQFRKTPEDNPRNDRAAKDDRPYLPPIDNGSPGYGSPANAGQQLYPGGNRDQSIYTEPVPSRPLDEGNRGVETNELAPVMAGDGSELPYELWRGLTIEKIEEHIATLHIPPRSAALHNLWHRLVTSEGSLAAGEPTAARFAALRGEALFRSGLLKESANALAPVPNAGSDALLGTLKARSAIAAGDRVQGCAIAKGLASQISEIPKSLVGEAILAIGYCAAVDGNRAAAGLSAELARDHGLDNSPGLDALTAFAIGGSMDATAAGRQGVIDYRILQRTQRSDVTPNLEGAEPALLAALALDPQTPAQVRLKAAEKAVAVNAIANEALAGIYRDQGFQQPQVQTSSFGQGSEHHDDGAARRAALFNAAETERMPIRKARHIRAFLDDARRAGFYWHALSMMAAPANELALLPEIAWFAETGIETSLVGGDYAGARRWASFAASQRHQGGAGLDHWIGLIDIADPAPASGREITGLAMIESLALQGRFNPDLLHRIATVLDALDVQVPIPLWETASRTSQPTGGHLPETGVLSELQSAAKKKEFGHTILLAMKTLGPDGAEGAHMIALGDSIRALKRAGLTGDARKLGLEALFASWPRAVSN